MAHNDLVTPVGFSRRSVRRRIRDSVNHMAELLSAEESQSQFLNCLSPVSDQSDMTYDCETNNVAMDIIVDSEHETVTEITEESQCLEFDNGDEGCVFSTDSECSESEHWPKPELFDAEGHPSVPISTSIVEWYFHNRISISALGGLLSALKPHHPELPLDPRTLLKTPTNYVMREISGQQGHYYHFGIAAGIDLDCCPPSGPIKLQFNLDGLPLYKSSSTELWPILCLVKYNNSKPFVVGLYCGKKKPRDLDEFLSDFVDDLQNVLLRGIERNGNHREVAVDCFVCDAPARAYIKNTKLYSGYFGCDKCVQEGEYVDGKVTFPLTTARLRTDVEFRDMVDEEHQHGPSPLTRLGFGMVTDFVFDYMHMVCLGVVRRLLNFWLKGPIRKETLLASRLPARTVASLSDRLVELATFVPREFARKPRTVAELDRWKATEFRQLLMYTGPVVLNGILPKPVFDHFMLLSVGISLLCSPRFCLEFNTYAHELLVTFVQMSERIYNPGFLVYNVHGLVHIADDVRRHGNLDSCSAFPFENHLRMLKLLVRKSSLPLPQIVRRISERMLFRESPTIKTVPQISVKAEHFDGPVPLGYEGARQYSQLWRGGIFLSLDVRDNCVAQDDMLPALIRNILLIADQYFIVCESFGVVSDLFDDPLPSSSLAIFKASVPSRNLKVLPVTEAILKCVCLPLPNDPEKFAVFPLLHCS